MATSTPKKFLVLYLAPVQVLEDWAKTDPEARRSAEATMRREWDRWMKEHAHLISVTEAGGRTKTVSAAGIADTRNEIMLYSLVQAESHEAAAQAFADHPHLTIPQASIQVMDVRSLSGERA